MAQDAAGPPGEPCPSPGLATAGQGRASTVNCVRLREVGATHLPRQYYRVHRKGFTQQAGLPINTLPAQQKCGTPCVTRASLVTSIHVTSGTSLVTTWGGLCWSSSHSVSLTSGGWGRRSVGHRNPGQQGHCHTSWGQSLARAGRAPHRLCDCPGRGSWKLPPVPSPLTSALLCMMSFCPSTKHSGSKTALLRAESLSPGGPGGTPEGAVCPEAQSQGFSSSH